MRPEKPPQEWLWKAWDGNVLIDLIFAPRARDHHPAVREQIDWRYGAEARLLTPPAAS
jgi:GTP-dependent phosphoenolpyruvate carboxykinase